VRLGVLVLAGIWIAMVAASWADASEEVGQAPAQPSQSQEPNRSPAGSQSEDEYSFKWLDPDKKIYVLQNRRYLKGGHLLISAMGGLGFSNAYRNSYAADPRIAYYFSELFGFEVFYSFTFNSENNNYAALKNAAPNTLPVIREIRSQAGALLHYAPWYAKINVFNKILYFDWYFDAGAGRISTALDTRTNVNRAASFQNQDFFAIYAGTGHQYHLSQNFIVRLDFSGTYYMAPIFGNSGADTWFSSYVFAAGLGLRL
jgi:outer membrane beta-barrel protein